MNQVMINAVELDLMIKEIDDLKIKNDLFKRQLADAAEGKREWVGLTPREFNEIKDNSTAIGYAIMATEFKLREKNGG